MIAELKSIESLIGSSAILADISGLSFLPMLDGKNGENVVEFDLIPEDGNFPCNKVLLVYCRLDRNYVVVKATELV